MENQGSNGGLKGWITIVLTVLFILSFMQYIGPWMEDKIPGFGELAKFIDENDIDANQYFYTEVDEFADADVGMQNTRDYPPTGGRN